jgi:hypothetical protein
LLNSIHSAYYCPENKILQTKTYCRGILHLIQTICLPFVMLFYDNSNFITCIFLLSLCSFVYHYIDASVNVFYWYMSLLFNYLDFSFIGVICLMPLLEYNINYAIMPFILELIPFIYEYYNKTILSDKIKQLPHVLFFLIGFYYYYYKYAFFNFFIGMSIYILSFYVFSLRKKYNDYISSHEIFHLILSVAFIINYITINLIDKS